MTERIRPTRSGLFAIELLIAVGVFTFCAAVCMGIFVRAEVMSRKSAEMTAAVNAAQNAADCFKAAGGDIARAAELSGGAAEQGALWVRYDGDWNLVSDGGVYAVCLEPQAAEGYAKAGLRVTDSREKEPILSWTVAALEVEP